MLNLQDYVRSHVPRCLAQVRASVVTPLVDRRDVSVAFRLSSEGGHRFAQILGYDLRAYNLEYKGDCEFISPLYIQWQGDSVRVLIFDSEAHGYHGEMESSAKLHGSGEPIAYACPKCNGKQFIPFVQFDYWDACYDLWEDEPEIAIENYFCNVIVRGECMNCGQASNVLDMDL